MLTVSDELRNAFMKDKRTIYVRIKIGNRVFDNDNAISVDYDAGSLSGEVFAIGSTYSNSVKITFSELVEGLKELDEVTYEIGIKLPNGKIEYVPMGVFVINDSIEMDRNNNKTTIECMDRMVMMGGAYESSLTYPAAIREVALEIANKAGVQAADTFDRLSADVIVKPEGYTYREAIGLIAQFEAGFATFNRYGKLEIRTLSDPNFSIPPDNYFSKGLVKNEVFFRLGGISCTTDESGDAVIQSGNTAGNQVVLENRVMTKALLDKIYQKIQTINYYPFSLSWQGNPVLEAGDWVEVEDLQGNKFKTPNLSYSLSFNGGLSAKSSAETVTQSNATYQYKSPLQQKIEWVHARIDAAGGNVVYEGIDEPANPKEGDLWFKIIGPDKEILIYKKRVDGSLFWEPQISTADIDKVAKEVGAIIKQADADREKSEQDFETAKSEAKQYTEQKANEFNGQLEIVRADVADTELKANASLAKADQAIKDAGFAQVDASAAKKNATNALTAANAAKVDSASALTKANTAITDSSKALTNANSALTRVGAVEVTTGSLTTSYDALTKAVALKADQTTVDGINGKVTTQGLAITANATAIGLKADKTLVDTINNTVSKHTTDIKATADGLLLKADSSVVSILSGTVTTHTTQIKAASDGLALKADSSLVNTIKGTVDTHTTQIKATSDGLALKADSTLVNTIKGTVDTHTTQIKATSDGLALKADSTLVNTIKGTVDNHSTQISANSTAITARLTSAQVETILTGKKYVNETTLSATSAGLTAQITQVSSDLSNLEIGGRNLLAGTSDQWRSRTFGGWDSYFSYVAVQEGDWITGTMYLKPTNQQAKVMLEFAPTNSSSYISQAASTTIISPGSEGYSSVTAKVPAGATRVRISIRHQSGSTPSDTVQYKKEKVEFGTKITDWSPAPEDLATVERVVTIEANINGINATVASKANQTQVTQLDDAYRILNNSTVKSLISDGNWRTGWSSGTQTAITSTSTDVTVIMNVDDTSTNSTNNRIWRPVDFYVGTTYTIKMKVRSSAPGLISVGQSGAPANGTFETATAAKVISFSYEPNTANAFSIFMNKKGTYYFSDIMIYESGGASETQLLMLNNSINLRATKANLMSQLNINPEGILLQGKNIMLDGNVSMDNAFINKMKVHSLDAVIADIGTLRTKMLTADVILSTMIKSDTALITKLFATDANVSILTAKAAFINSVKAIDIAADRINTGTLNAAKVTIINLDASRITTGTLSGANYALNLITGSETFRNPNNGNTLLIQQDKFYFDTNSASHYLIPDNEGFALVPGTGNTGNNRNAGIRLKSTNFNYLDLGLGSDGGFQYRIGGYANNFAFMSKNSGDFVFSHTAIGDSNVGSHMWKLQDGNYGTLNYGKTNLVINGYDGSVVPKVSVFNPANGQLATFDTQFLNLTGPTGTIELSQAGGSFKITHGVNRNWVFAQGNNGTVTYGTTMIALNGHNNASARLSVYGSNGTTYGYMSAANFDVQSERKYKDNITDFGSALSIISTMKIRQYDKNGVSEIGVITDEAPLQLLADNDTKVSLYDYASLAVRGVQELGDLTWNHEVKLSKHELKIKELEEKIKQLESAA